MTESTGATNAMGPSSSTSGPIQTIDPVLKPMVKRKPPVSLSDVLKRKDNG